ncbi:MAG: hypothetical protein A2X84_04985 [Desulfuromonadaceae bacterium GWC2_58_13]|nr:MAG: hypothetical protein A2X84_04985 [Desulfuromonadaceae bacterium GWC2_58_13]
MMIRVMYSDWRQDMVSAEALDRLLALKRVKKFKRFNGWVNVGYDSIRGTGGEGYKGPDRRGASSEPRRLAGRG